MTCYLPPFVREMLATPPRAGEGVHGFIFRAARQLHAHYPATEIVRILESVVAGCGRHVPRNEIISAVQNSVPCAWQPRGASTAFRTPANSKWPEMNVKRIEAICAEGYGLANLWELSPIRIEDNRTHTEEIIDLLFPSNPYGAEQN